MFIYALVSICVCYNGIFRIYALLAYVWGRICEGLPIKNVNFYLRNLQFHLSQENNK